jgi:NAD(P)-dependent dehydrogenase (short-subunit alcohol dehydrogenase family)
LSKVIVITGAGAGLGLTLARRFAGEGDSVVLLGRTASKLDAAAAEIGDSALAVQCDVGSPASVTAAFAKIAERHPKIDVLINNAAIFQPTQIAEASDEHIVGTVTTNLIGAMLCARHALGMMGPGGHIINVSSESVEMPFAHLIAYQASKAGLERFSLSLQAEVESRGVRVTIVRCGQMYSEGKTWDIDPEAGMRFFQANIERGLNLAQRPLSHVNSVSNLFRAVIDLPPDVQVVKVQVSGRTPD